MELDSTFEEGDSSILADSSASLEKNRERKRMYNVIMLGIGFMFIFAAFNSASMISASVLRSAKAEDSSFDGDGYISLAIVYTVFAVSSWFSPFFIKLLQPKASMIGCAFVYCSFIASFLHPMTWALYLLSVLLGMAAALMWTAQGVFLTRNSTAVTMSRNSGIFVVILQGSILIGNTFIYFEFRKVIADIIETEQRHIVYGGLTGACFLGLMTLCLLRQPPPKGIPNEETADEFKCTSQIKLILAAGKLLLTRDMALLSITFLYTGLQLTFCSGVYGTSIGGTISLGDQRSTLIPITGIVLGAGEITTGLLMSIFSKFVNKYGRDLVVLIGFLTEVIALLLIFLHLPDQSPLTQTSDTTYFKPNQTIFLVCSFMMGFSNGCFGTQILSLLGVVYADNSAPAFAIFKFMQSLSAAVGFFYSTVLVLKYQLLLILTMAILGFSAFCIVEWTVYKEIKKKER